jgi:hypothetical protein
MVKHLAVMADKGNLAVCTHFAKLGRANVKQLAGCFFINVLIESNQCRIFAEVVNADSVMFYMIHKEVNI